MKKRLIYLVIALTLFFQISIWPFFMLGFAIVWISSLVKGAEKNLNIRLLAASLMFITGFGEIVARIKGDNQVYTESIKAPMHHILFTSYVSPFKPQEKGWLHLRDSGYHEREEATEYVREAWQTNNEGLKDQNWSMAKTDKCRVIVIGDSFTEGVGASQDSSYTKLLSKKNRSLEIMNAGVSGSDPAFELKLLEMRLFKYHPDIVIMSINKSDIFEFLTRVGIERFSADSTLQFKSAPWWEPLFANSFIVRSFVNGICKLDHNLMSTKDIYKAYPVALRQLDEVILQASKECQERNIRFIVNFHPTSNEVRCNSMECTPVMQKIKSQGVETFNMLDYYIHHGIDSAHAGLYYWPIDGHHNNRGYAVMAEGLATLFR